MEAHKVGAGVFVFDLATVEELLVENTSLTVIGLSHGPVINGRGAILVEQVKPSSLGVNG